VTKTSQISRAGVIIKQVEEATKCTISKLQTDNLTQEREGKTIRILAFICRFSKKQ